MSMLCRPYGAILRYTVRATTLAPLRGFFGMPFRRRATTWGLADGFRLSASGFRLAHSYLSLRGTRGISVGCCWADGVPWQSTARLATGMLVRGRGRSRRRLATTFRATAVSDPSQHSPSLHGPSGDTGLSSGLL
jgi:hypothetical protein